MMGSKTVLGAQFSAELAALGQQMVEMRLPALDVWMILVQLQLAARSPLNDGPSAQIAKEIGMELQGYVAVTPALESVAEQGWDESCDVDRSPRVAVQLADVAAVARLCRVADKARRLVGPALAGELEEAVGDADRLVGRWAAEMEGVEHGE